MREAGRLHAARFSDVAVADDLFRVYDEALAS
jgi:hypothetical protein